MKTFKFDAAGNMNVKDDADGREWDIQRDQVGKHLPMFKDEMPVDVLASVNAIIESGDGA